MMSMHQATGDSKHQVAHPTSVYTVVLSLITDTLVNDETDTPPLESGLPASISAVSPPFTVLDVASSASPCDRSPVRPMQKVFPTRMEKSSGDAGSLAPPAVLLLATRLFAAFN